MPKASASTISAWDKLWHLPENREFDVGPSWRSKLRHLHRLVGQETIGGKVLDVACGMGRLLKEFDGRAGELVGIDASTEALKAAQIYFPKARYQQLNIEHEILHETFDWIFCTNALEEMENDEAALRNMAAMLKPGGKLIVVVPHRHMYWTSKDRMAGNKRRYEIFELVEKMQRGGLTVVTYRTWGWPLYRVWYHLMERVDQGKIWNKKSVSRLARALAHVAYLGLMFDDLFTGSSYGSVLLMMAHKPRKA